MMQVVLSSRFEVTIPGKAKVGVSRQRPLLPDQRFRYLQGIIGLA